MNDGDPPLEGVGTSCTTSRKYMMFGLGLGQKKKKFYTLKDPISFNAPPPPDCKSCKKQGSLFVILPPPGRQLKIRVFSLSPTEKSVFPKPATVY